MAIQTSEIVTAFGNYYIKGQQNMKRLKNKITQGSVTLNIPGIRHIKTDETAYQSSNNESTEVIQAYQHGFTPKGDHTFHPNNILLHRIKADQTYQPDAVYDSWLEFLAATNNKPETFPIVRYIMEVMLPAQIEQDRELSMVYNGIAATPTTGTAGSAKNSMDGFQITLRRSALATHVYPIHVVDNGIGELNSTDIFDQIEKFADAIPERLKRLPFIFFVSPDMEMAYLRKKRTLGYYQINGDKEIRPNVDFTNFRVVGVPSMTGSKHLWATIPQNILYLSKKTWKPGQFDMQVDKRDVNVLGDWMEGLGFEDNDLVFASKVTSQVKVSVKSSDTTKGSVAITGGTDGVKYVDLGDDVAITATAESGSTFTKWSDGNTNASRTLSDVMEDASLTAIFA